MMLGVMCFLSLLGIAVVVKSNIFRYGYESVRILYIISVCISLFSRRQAFVRCPAIQADVCDNGIE